MNDNNNIEQAIKMMVSALPYTQKEKIRTEIAYYESQIEYWHSSAGFKYKFGRKQISLILWLSAIDKHIITPMNDAKEFLSRMRKFGVSNIQSGSTKLDGEVAKEINAAVADFNSLIFSFLASYDIKMGREFLRFEEIKDFIDLIKEK